MLDFSNVNGDGSTRGEGASRGSKLVVGGPPSRIVGCCPGNSSVQLMSALCRHEEFDPSHTLHWMSLSSLSLCDEFLFLLFPSLKLLYSLIVVINSNPQGPLCPILTNDKLVEMLLEHFGGQSGRSIRRCASQWTRCGQARFIGAGEWLVHKVGSVKLRGRG